MTSYKQEGDQAAEGSHYKSDLQENSDTESK